MDNPYNILEISLRASTETANAAYRALLKKHKEDKDKIFYLNAKGLGMGLED